MSIRVFVTGGAGFIGSHVVDECLARGYSVLVYDNFSRGRDEFLTKTTSLRIQRGDILNRSLLHSALAEYAPTHLIHLAALHYIPYCNQHPEETIDVNVKGTQNLLDAATQCAGTLRKVLFASSAAVYRPSTSLHREDEPLGPTDIYGCSKYMNEIQARMFHESTGIPTVAARIFNAYGTRETNPHLIPEIIAQWRSGKREIELGNLTTKRSYIYVRDLARGIVDLLAGDTGGAYEAFNIGSHTEYSAAELLSLLGEVTGTAITAHSIGSRKRASDRPRLQPDLQKIASTVGWKEQYSMSLGLQDILHEEQ